MTSLRRRGPGPIAVLPLALCAALLGFGGLLPSAAAVPLRHGHTGAPYYPSVDYGFASPTQQFCGGYGGGKPQFNTSTGRGTAITLGDSRQCRYSNAYTEGAQTTYQQLSFNVRGLSGANPTIEVVVQLNYAAAVSLSRGGPCVSANASLAVVRGHSRSLCEVWAGTDSFFVLSLTDWTNGTTVNGSSAFPGTTALAVTDLDTCTATGCAWTNRSTNVTGRSFAANQTLRLWVRPGFAFRPTDHLQLNLEVGVAAETGLFVTSTQGPRGWIGGADARASFNLGSAGHFWSLHAIIVR